MFSLFKRVFRAKPKRNGSETEPKRLALPAEHIPPDMLLRSETQPAGSAAEATLSAPSVRLPEPATDDTKPTRPVAIEEIPPAVDDTKPRPVVPSPPPRPPRHRPRYPDPSDPYAGLFPPPKPGDDDYYETAAADDDTPPSGMRPHSD